MKTREVFFLKITECYSTFIYIMFCHMSNLPELSIYAKDVTVEMALKSAQNTQKRNKIGDFRFPTFKSIFLGKLT